MAFTNADADPRRPWLTLWRLEGVGPRLFQKLLAAFGEPSAALDASTPTLAAAGLPRRAQAQLNSHLAGRPEDRLEAGVRRDLAWLAGPQRHLLRITDPEYPPLLKTLPDAPPVLFVEGRTDALSAPQLALVGSRNPSPDGREHARRFAYSLASKGLAVTSGLALGIDGFAHQGALDADGITLAVLGQGPDRVYPAQHAALAEAIPRRGALVSEFPVGTPPDRRHFPRRNRLISGLSLGVLVVEAGLKSGSLITARLAGEQGRDVFALPGSVQNPLSKGCHRLIQEGAQLVESVADLEAGLNPHLAAVTAEADPRSDGAPPEGEPPALTRYPADADSRAVLTVLGRGPVDADTLIERSGLSVERASAALTQLELGGWVSWSAAGYQLGPWVPPE